MKTNHVLAVIFASALLVLSSSAMAQQAQAPRNALRAGQSALSFQVPWGGNPHVQNADTNNQGSLGGLGGLLSAAGDSTLGYHYMFTDNIRGGLNLGLNVASTTVVPEQGDEESATRFGLNIAPQMNYYTRTRGTVAPYFFGQLALSTFSDGSDSTTGDIDEARDDNEVRFNANEQTTLAAALGFGVEWFPVTRFSISGQVGLNVNVIGRDQFDEGSGTVVEQGFGLNLFTSALAANIYF